MMSRMVWVSRHSGRQSLFRPHCSGCDLAHDVSADPVPGRPRRQLAVRALDRFKRPTVGFRPSLRRSLAEFNYICVVGFTKESDPRAAQRASRAVRKKKPPREASRRQKPFCPSV